MNLDPKPMEASFLSTTCNNMSSSSSSSPKKWRKILYKDNGYPDNHVDSSFLDEMRKNISTPIYSWRRVVFEAEVVSRQLSAVSLFLATFFFLFLEWTTPKFLLSVAGVVSAIGFLVYRIALYTSSSSSSSSSCSSTPFLSLSDCLSFLQCFPCLTLCYGLSPILITLTRTISQDTLFAMTASMLFAYLLFFDYRASASMTSSPISLNAAIFASVCLASRLPSVLHTFAIVSVALVTFALWPPLHRRLGTLLTPLLLHVSTATLIGVSIAAVAQVSVVGGWLLMATHFLILIFCPLLFVNLQKDKHNIYGPWDEAVIKE